MTLKFHLMLSFWPDSVIALLLYFINLSVKLIISNTIIQIFSKYKDKHSKINKLYDGRDGFRNNNILESVLGVIVTLFFLLNYCILETNVVLTIYILPALRT